MPPVFPLPPRLSTLRVKNHFQLRDTSVPALRGHFQGAFPVHVLYSHHAAPSAQQQPSA